MTNGQQPGEQQVNQAADAYGLQQGYQNLQTQQQVTGQADQQAAAQTQNVFMRPFAPLLKQLDEAQAKTQYNDKLPNEAHSLRQGVVTRSAPGFQAANYPGYSHPQLHQMVTQGVDASTVGEVGDTWLAMGDDLTGFQADFARALASSETTWTGTNADAARRSVAELGNSGGAIGQAAQLAGVVTHQQSQALATAKNSMPPPPAHVFTAQAAQQQLQTITDPVALATQAATDHAVAAQQQAHQQAAMVVREYDTTVAQTSAAMPAFAPAPAVVHSPAGPGQPSGPAPSSSGGTRHGGGFAPYRAAGSGLGGSPSPTGSGGVTGVPTGAGAVGQPGAVNLGSGPGQTTSSDYVGPTPPGGSSPGGSFSGGVPSGTSPYLPGSSGNPGGVGGSGAGVGSSRLGAGAGGSGAGGEGAQSGTGARSGTGAAEDAATTGGGTGARGAAGNEGSPMMGGARGGKGTGDDEHKRPEYLLESDPESLFGTDEKTAPPVIGEYPTGE